MATTDAAKQYAAQAIAQGEPRKDIVSQLKEFFGVSQATAYRLVADCMSAAANKEDADSVPDDVDILAEAVRQYRAAIAAGDHKRQLQWFSQLVRIQNG